MSAFRVQDIGFGGLGLGVGRQGLRIRDECSGVIGVHRRGGV